MAERISGTARLPSPKKEYSVRYDRLSGGIDLFELDYRIGRNESPEMKNLLWRGGALNCRDGQVWLDSTPRGTGYAAHKRLWHGRIAAHIGNALFMLDPETGSAEEIYSGVPENPGCFFEYGERLYYKNRGGYIAVSADMTASAVEGYIPVTVINADPLTGAGDLYQPENRLSPAKTVWYNAARGVREYRLPVQNIDSVLSAEVNGEQVRFTADTQTGTVIFEETPAAATPAQNNTVRITYSKADPDSMASIMSCRCAQVYGGTGELCIVLGACEAQPNAYFWNGGSAAMDAGYFPMPQYQLAGDSGEAVTGFGIQHGSLIIFKERSVGRTSVELEDIDGRSTVSLPYTQINGGTGCDLPGTVELVENNLVWANSSGGVFRLRDTSAALENNISCISRKINGSAGFGLLRDLNETGALPVCSCDDGQHYYLAAASHVWVWDYEVSDSSDPSWFYFTDISPAAFICDHGRLWHLDTLGRFTAFERVYADYGRPIEKLYRFATEYFDSYEREKNVDSVVIAMRSDTNCTAQLSYITDFGRRTDSARLSGLNWALYPRNLLFRSLRGRGFAAVYRRRPMCRRIRHFAMCLENNELGQDLSIVSAQVFFRYGGELR